MHVADYLVLTGYFGLMVGIGIYCSRRIKHQEDFFLGGRGFGKLLQTFAAFGAGTGSADPVNTARGTYVGGMSGMWSVMYWLFVTPFYWITGVWYRRMRHLTLGDWFVERYESKALGAAYSLFAIVFMIIYGSMMFSAIGKVAAPLMNIQGVEIAGTEYGLEYILVPIIGVVVLVYGLAGGLEAAYYTDLIQGIGIILLSIILIPVGLLKLNARFGGEGMLDGFRIIHEQLPAEHFTILGSGSSSEFPLYYILAVVLINLVGIVIQPHFIATGGGSAKNETSARVGLVTGNFLKRFCTLGWVLTALIALALFADHPELVQDPEKAWGVASRELLGPGLTGLMLACLLAALMSSVDAYMVVGSGLVARNIYAAYFNPSASEKTYINIGRLTGAVIVAGAVIVSLTMMDVFKQLQLTWIVPTLFAATFWIGMYWRRATTGAAWCTVIFCALVFFILPFVIPVAFPGLRTSPRFNGTNDQVTTTSQRIVAPSDIAQRRGKIKLWTDVRDLMDQRDAADEKKETAKVAKLEAKLKKLGYAKKKKADLGPRPAPIDPTEKIEITATSGGKSVFWTGGVKPVDPKTGKELANAKLVVVETTDSKDDGTTKVRKRYGERETLQGQGQFRIDFLFYQLLGIDFKGVSDAMLKTLELPVKIFAPFLVMICCSLVTRRNSQEALDRYYIKMKTPVDSDRNRDDQLLQEALANPPDESKKLFPGSNFEFQKPSATDILGFLISLGICFGVIGLAFWIAGIGSK